MACNFIKKETVAQAFTCEFCEIFKNVFFTERLLMTASKYNHLETPKSLLFTCLHITFDKKLITFRLKERNTESVESFIHNVRQIKKGEKAGFSRNEGKSYSFNKNVVFEHTRKVFSLSFLLYLLYLHLWMKLSDKYSYKFLHVKYLSGALGTPLL